MKKRLKLTLTLAVLIILTASVSVLAQDSSENTSLLEQEEWNDTPRYAHNLSVRIMHTGIQERKQVEYCSEYNESECLEKQNRTVSGESKYLFDLENIETRYIGNGKIYISFVAQPNNITNILHLEDTPATTKEEAVKEFNQKYLYRGENLTEETYDKLKNRAKNTTADPMGGAIKAHKVDNSNLMSDSGKFEFVLEFEELRHAGVSLNDAVGLRLETSAYNGKGGQP